MISTSKAGFILQGAIRRAAAPGTVLGRLRPSASATMGGGGGAPFVSTRASASGHCVCAPENDLGSFVSSLLAPSICRINPHFYDESSDSVPLAGIASPSVVLLQISSRFLSRKGKFLQDLFQIVSLPAVFHADRDRKILASVAGDISSLPFLHNPNRIPGPILFIQNLDTGDGWIEFLFMFERTAQLAGPAASTGWHIKFHGLAPFVPQ